MGKQESFPSHIYISTGCRPLYGKMLTCPAVVVVVVQKQDPIDMKIPESEYNG